MQKIYVLAIIALSLLNFPAEAKSKAKVLPSQLQKAYVIQKSAFVYTRPDFDAQRIIGIPAGTKVTISKKIYRPKTGFGTFYRIYLAKPKKIRAYISEIDVVPRNITSPKGWRKNKEFDLVKKKLKKVKEFEYNSKSESSIDMESSALLEQKFIGMMVTYNWLAYSSEPKRTPTWFFGLRLSGKGLPIKDITTDINIKASLKAPIIDKKQLKKGYTLITDLLFKMPLFNAPSFMFQLGTGFMVKIKGARRPEDPSQSTVGAGLAGSGTVVLKIHDRMVFLTETKFYYDLLEERLVPGLSGGLLVTF